ncbi:hypothetical protein RW64_09675 [Geobacter sulfurreducens]|nr:hypothetical protein RW64_09675 [Geobacter sulfurreducens]
MGKYPPDNKDTRVSREQLYEEVWAEPMTKVALKYGVSSSFMARVCTWLNVPRPERGYWAKLAVGKSTKQPPLPEAEPGDELEWNRYGPARRAKLPIPKPPRKRKSRLRDRSELPERHPLLQGAQQYFDEARETCNGYLRPSKRLMVDVIASKQACSRALDVANELFLLFEERGYPVSFERHGLGLRRSAVDEREKGGRDRNYSELWSPSRDTIVTIGSVLIGLTIFEMSENVEAKYQDGKYVRVSELPVRKTRRYESYSWTSMHDLPSGRLCIQAYSPYQRASWQRQWRETKAGDFPVKLSAIVKELKRETATIVQLVEEGERKAEFERKEWEAQQIIWRREEEERRRVKAIKESREELAEIIKAWVKAKGIEEFFADIERRAANLDEEQKTIVMERLNQARTLIDSTDALQWLAAWKTPEERKSSYNQYGY